MSPSQNLKHFYDHHSNFANRRLTEYNLSPGIKCKFDTILKHLRNHAFARALDIGCSGNSFIHFLPEVKHRVLCDLAHSPLLQYQSFARYHSVCGSITDFPFESNSFDLIAALDVLEHIPNDSAARSELSRVLAPKGLLIITVPHRMAFYTKQDRIVGHVRRYEYTQIKDLFSFSRIAGIGSVSCLWTIYALTICPRSESTKNRRKLNPITLPICRRSDVPKLLFNLFG